VVPALIVTREDCPWCVKLKELLSEEGIKFEEISKAEAIEKGYWKSEWKTVPQMWLYKKHIGGYTDYVAHTQKPTEVDYAECAACES
jgi:glutaredoxin